MSPLFEPRIVHRDASGARLELLLEPDEPYLDHHRPGGQPLLATVLGLEAIVAAARAVKPGAGPHVSAVKVGEPCILPDSQPYCVQIDVRPAAHDAGLDCVLSSRRPDGGQAVHFAAHVLPDGPPALAPEAGAQGASGVRSEEVYAHFFHGPAFRVIRSARWLGERLSAQMAPDLPDLRAAGPSRTWVAPRLIEFGLQAAGLLELARSGEMRIPEAIGAVRLADAGRTVHADGYQALAIARQDAAIDVHVTSASGMPALSIEGYRTASLPFAQHGASRSRLAAALRASCFEIHDQGA